MIEDRGVNSRCIAAGRGRVAATQEEITGQRDTYLGIEHGIHHDSCGVVVCLLIQGTTALAGGDDGGDAVACQSITSESYIKAITQQEECTLFNRMERQTDE